MVPGDRSLWRGLIAAAMPVLLAVAVVAAVSVLDNDDGRHVISDQVTRIVRAKAVPIAGVDAVRYDAAYPDFGPGPRTLVKAMCGSYSVESLWGPGERAVRTSSVDVRGRTSDQGGYGDFNDGFLGVLDWCGDVLGTGESVLKYTWVHGGTMPCADEKVVRLGEARAHVLLSLERTCTGVGEPRQLDGEGALELPGGLAGLTWEVPSIGFATLPPALPVVFRFDGARYVEATRRFPEFLREEMAAQLEELELTFGYVRDHEEAGEEDLAASERERMRAAAVHVYAMHVLLGTEDEGVDLLTDMLDPVDLKWLVDHADEITSLVNEEYAAP